MNETPNETPNENTLEVLRVMLEAAQLMRRGKRRELVSAAALEEESYARRVDEMEAALENQKTSKTAKKQTTKLQPA